MIATVSCHEFRAYFNELLHDFLEANFFSLHGAEFRKRKEEKDPVYLEDLEIFFPAEHFVRENLEKCEKVVEDLFIWSKDEFCHHLDELHQYALYNFLMYMDDLLKDGEDKIFFNNKEDRVAIDKLWERMDFEEYEFVDKKDLAGFAHDAIVMAEAFTEDIDFITFPWLIAKASADDADVPRGLLDYYADFIPEDVVKYYRENHKHSGILEEDLDRFFATLIHDVAYRHHGRLLWHKSKTANETEAKDLLQALMESFAWSVEVLIDREVDTGPGDVDFRVASRKDHKALIEVKLASNSGLVAGLAKQLPRYMDAEKCKLGYYVVVCYSESQLQKAQKLARMNLEDAKSNIKVIVLDAVKKVVPSKLR